MDLKNVDMYVPRSPRSTCFLVIELNTPKKVVALHSDIVGCSSELRDLILLMPISANIL